MKRRRTLIISLLLVATLVLGIGYAALTVPLEIDGTIYFDPEQAEVEYEADVFFAEGKAESAYCKADVSASSDKVGVLYIGGEHSAELTTPQQSAVAKYKVANKYESKVEVTVNASAELAAGYNKVTGKEYVHYDLAELNGLFDVEVAYGTEDAPNPALDELTIEAGTEQDPAYGWVWITITPTRNVDTVIDGGKIHIHMNATTVDN